MSTIDQTRAAIDAEITRKRRALASGSPEAFGRVYLSHHFEHPSSPMHDEVFRLLAEASESRGRRIAIAAPRGHAKSTCVSLAYVLYAVLCHNEPYTLIVSATKEQASQLLKHVKDEIETNEKIRSDFPEVYASKPTPWRGTKISLPSGQMLHALGHGQQVRGTRHRAARPSLIIADDLETQENVRSEEQRIKTREWFEKTLLKVGDERTNAVVVGTVLHYDSLLAQLMDERLTPGWTRRKYRALISEPTATQLWGRWEQIYTGREEHDGATGPDAARAFYIANKAEMDEGAEVLWPEREPIETLMAIRVREGRPSFDSEKQNEPLDPEQCLFRPESLVYWDDEFADEQALLTHLGTSVRICGAWDPSLGTNPARGDHSAVVIIARLNKVSYVLAADIERRTPAQMIDRIVEYAKIYNISDFALEANGFQRELAKPLRAAAAKAKVRLPIRQITNTGNKAGRIELLEPLISQGRVRFCRKHHTLMEQLRQFPLAAHDDGPDALDMALRIAVRTRPRMGELDRRTGKITWYDLGGGDS